VGSDLGVCVIDGANSRGRHRGWIPSDMTVRARPDHSIPDPAGRSSTSPPYVRSPALAIQLWTYRPSSAARSQSERLGLRWAMLTGLFSGSGFATPLHAGSSPPRASRTYRRAAPLPMADRVVAELVRWSQRSAHTTQRDPVVAYPRPATRSIARRSGVASSSPAPMPA